MVYQYALSVAVALVATGHEPVARLRFSRVSFPLRSHGRGGLAAVPDIFLSRKVTLKRSSTKRGGATAISGNLLIRHLAMHGEAPRLQVKAMRNRNYRTGNLLNIEQRSPKQIVTKVDPLDDPDLILRLCLLGRLSRMFGSYI
jgi:hypothetical protein